MSPGGDAGAFPAPEIDTGGPSRRGGGLLWLLRPKLLSARGAEEGRVGRIALVAAVGALVLPLIYLALTRLLRALRTTPEVGALLSSKLLGFGLMILLGILLLSNLIAALSSFFLSRDLAAIRSAPVDWLDVYGARLTETAVNSSWMVALLLIPVLAAYGTVYSAGPAFYGLALVAMVPLLVIPAAAGSAITLMLVRVFPARRTRDILGVVAAGGVAVIVLALRVLQPERLVDPESFRNLVDFLDLLRAPTLAWFPSEWSAQALMGQLQDGLDPFYLLLLWTTAAGVVVVGAALHARFFDECFTRAQEGTQKRVRYGGVWALVERVLEPMELRRREMILKDARSFFRDATQWSQLIVLGVLVVVYVYNIRVLPLESNEAIGAFLVSMVAFLNVALAGFVLAAVAARFVFPSVSLEGRTLWLLQSSPLPASTLLWSKFWAGAVPLLVLALLLTLLTSLGLGLGSAITGLSLLTILGLTLAFTSQALAWGVAYPKFETENAAQIPTSLGGLLFMLGALATLGLVVGGQFWILGDWLASGLPWRESRDPYAAEMALTVAFTAAVCVPAVAFPYRYARRTLEALET